jgi:hypothetical protein
MQNTEGKYERVLIRIEERLSQWEEGRICGDAAWNQTIIRKSFDQKQGSYYPVKREKIV